jgi:hypothetical protein
MEFGRSELAIDPISKAFSSLIPFHFISILNLIVSIPNSQQLATNWEPDSPFSLALFFHGLFSMAIGVVAFNIYIKKIEKEKGPMKTKMDIYGFGNWRWKSFRPHFLATSFGYWLLVT